MPHTSQPSDKAIHSIFLTMNKNLFTLSPYLPFPPPPPPNLPLSRPFTLSLIPPLPSASYLLKTFIFSFPSSLPPFIHLFRSLLSLQNSSPPSSTYLHTTLVFYFLPLKFASLLPLPALPLILPFYLCSSLPHNPYSSSFLHIKSPSLFLSPSFLQTASPMLSPHPSSPTPIVA